MFKLGEASAVYKLSQTGLITITDYINVIVLLIVCSTYVAHHKAIELPSQLCHDQPDMLRATIAMISSCISSITILMCSNDKANQLFLENSSVEGRLLSLLGYVFNDRFSTFVNVLMHADGFFGICGSVPLYWDDVLHDLNLLLIYAIHCRSEFCYPRLFDSTKGTGEVVDWGINIFCLMVAAPFCSLLSLHNLHHIDDIFSYKTTSNSKQHLSNKVEFDSVVAVMEVMLYKGKFLNILISHPHASSSSYLNLNEIPNKSLWIQDGLYTCAYFVGLLLQWLDKFKLLNSLCGTVFEVNQGEVTTFHSYAIKTLATFLHIVTNVAFRSGISKFCVGPSALSELTYNVVGIRLNFANGYDIALHGIASLFKTHHGFIKHCGLIGGVSSMLLVANIGLCGYVQEVLVRLNSTLDMLLQSDAVKYEFFGLMCDLEGMEIVYSQEVDCSLHFTFEQWDPDGHLDLKFKQWDPGKFSVEAGFYNLEDKVDLEGVGNDRIFRIMSTNVVTPLVLEGCMTHLNLERIF